MPQEQPQKFSEKNVCYLIYYKALICVVKLAKNNTFKTTQFTKPLVGIIYTTTDLNYVTFDRPNT